MSKKKTILIISGVILAICLVLGTIFLIKDIKGDSVLSIESGAALAGDNIEIELTLDKNKGFYMGCITLEYDSDAIEFVSCASGEVFDMIETNDTTGQLVMLAYQNDLSLAKSDGNIATLTFKVKRNAKDGDYEIKFVDETNFCNLDDPENLIVPELKNGIISVE